LAAARESGSDARPHVATNVLVKAFQSLARPCCPSLCRPAARSTAAAPEPPCLPPARVRETPQPCGSIIARDVPPRLVPAESRPGHSCNRRSWRRVLIDRARPRYCAGAEGVYHAEPTRVPAPQPFRKGAVWPDAERTEAAATPNPDVTVRVTHAPDRTATWSGSQWLGISTLRVRLLPYYARRGVSPSGEKGRAGRRIRKPGRTIGDTPDEALTGDP
jgi:hypothetical protein